MSMGTLDEPTVASVAARPAPARASVVLPEGYLLAGRYRIGDQLGAGGAAAVYRAEDTALNRPVAVKVFAPAGDPLGLAGHDDPTARFAAEVRTHARLRHRGLVQLFDAFEPAPSAEGDAADVDGAGGPESWGALVLELVPGGTLAQRLAGPYRTDGAAPTLALQLAETLSYLHGNGIAHCDVKPSNIVFGADGEAKLIDLGIAVDTACARTQVPSGWLAGTARYASPEQLRGRPLTTATDIYSLGLVLLDVLAGPRPASASALPIVDDAAVEVPDRLGSQWFWLLTAMLSGDPARRPSADDVALAVRRIACAA